MKKCVFCGADIKTIEDMEIERFEDFKVIINNIPTVYCDECKDKYYTPEINSNLDKIIEILKNIELNSKTISIDYENMTNALIKIKLM